MMKYLLTMLFAFSVSLQAYAATQVTYNKELDGFEYPFEVNTFDFNSQNQDLQMRYMDTGNKSAKKVAVLLHGKNFSGYYWEKVAKDLLEKGYRVVIPDQIGFGKSTKPAFYQYSFGQLALNTKLILDHLGVEEITLVGHSMGGMLATTFAVNYPTLVKKLILINPIGLEDWKLKVPYKPVEWWYANELKKSFEGIKNYQLVNYYDNKWKDDYDQWVNLLAGWTLNSDYKRIAWNAALTYDMIFTQPVVYEFEKIKVPTLLIIGTRDRTALGKPLVSEEVRKTMGLYDTLGKTTKQKIKNAQLVEIENIGHLPHIEKFESFIDPLIKFMKE